MTWELGNSCQYAREIFLRPHEGMHTTLSIQLASLIETFHRAFEAARTASLLVSAAALREMHTRITSRCRGWVGPKTLASRPIEADATMAARSCSSSLRQSYEIVWIEVQIDLTENRSEARHSTRASKIGNANQGCCSRLLPQ